MTLKSKIKVAISVTVVLMLTVIILVLVDSHFGGGFDETSDFVQVMDVGQGDSILIYSNGKSCIIDMATPLYANKICADLSRCNIRTPDVVLISHLHTDHIGGLSRVAEIYDIKNLIMPEILTNSIAEAQKAKDTVIASGGRYYTAVQGMNFNIGEFEITLLGNYSSNNENNRSIFAVAEIDGIKFLFTGDAEEWAEERLLEENVNLDCDVLKVAHHGSSGSTCIKFLQAVTPEYAVISVGEDNPYSHPNSDTLNALDEIGAEVFRTDTSGDVFFYIEDGKITTKTEK